VVLILLPGESMQAGVDYRNALVSKLRNASKILSIMKIPPEGTTGPILPMNRDNTVPTPTVTLEAWSHMAVKPLSLPFAE
jgi:hypothetical protein